MNGIVLINKEKDMTSRDVVNILSKKFNEKKIGHFGTLDPMATGLLVVGIGAYTKAQSLFINENKEYEVTVLVGTSTDTYDVTGNILEKKDIAIDKDKLIDSLLSLKGNYIQEVPIYSAVKVNGKKLYEYARNNMDVDLPKREVTIFDISFGSIYEQDNNTYFSFSCLVSKGTYIRSLINDLSNKLNIPMCMSDLKRTKCGNFSLESSYTISDVLDDKYELLSVSSFLDIEKMEIPSSLEKLIINGSIIDKISDKYILFTKDGVDISLYGTFEDKMKPYLTFKK